MKKYILSVPMCLMVICCPAQSEKFDIASFIPPEGWQRSDTLGSLSYFHMAAREGQNNFCQIILYPSSASTGNARLDFNTAWDHMVSKPTGTKAKPVIKTRKNPDGWTIVSGTGTINWQGLNYKTILTSISGYNKVMNIQVNLAGESYESIIKKFFEDLKIDQQIKTNGYQNNLSQLNMELVTMNDYEFMVPETWQKQLHADHIQLQNPQSGCVIRILAPQAGSGNPDEDARTVFNTMYQGWQYIKAGDQQYLLSKGQLTRGLPFSMMEATMSATLSNGQYVTEEGAALVIPVGSRIIIISIRHNISLMAHDACRLQYNTWRRFFNSFSLKNMATGQGETDASSRIIGAWSMLESGGSGEYVFAANGHYAYNGALASSYTTRDSYYEYIHIKTSSFSGDGSYSISANQLQLNKKNGVTERMQFRFEKANHGGTGWKDRIWLLKKDQFGENEVCYQKNE